MARKEGRKRVIFEIDLGLHCEVKSAAAKRNISMAEWMQRAIIQKLDRDKKQEEHIQIEE